MRCNHCGHDADAADALAEAARAVMPATFLIDVRPEWPALEKALARYDAERHLACEHERLNEEGICRACGEDCRGIGQPAETDMNVPRCRLGSGLSSGEKPNLDKLPNQPAAPAAEPVNAELLTAFKTLAAQYRRYMGRPFREYASAVIARADAAPAETAREASALEPIPIEYIRRIADGGCDNADVDATCLDRGDAKPCYPCRCQKWLAEREQK